MPAPATAIGALLAAATAGCGDAPATGIDASSVASADAGAGTDASGDIDAVAAAPDANGYPCAAASMSFALREGAQHVAVDGAGNIVVAGRLTRLVDYGGGVLEPLGSDDVGLAKYDAAGGHVWSKRLGGVDRDYVTGLAVTETGDVVIAGHFWATASFGGAAHDAGDSVDAYVARFSPDGEPQWSRFLAGDGVQSYQHVAVDASGAVVAAGTFENSTSFAGVGRTAVGARDAVLAVYTADGDEDWAHVLASENATTVAGVVAGSRYVLVGQFSAAIDLGEGVVESAGPSDIFMVGYTPSGDWAWARVVGGDDTEVARGVAADPSGADFVIAGEFGGSVDFGGGPALALSSSDLFAARYDMAGDHSWNISFYNALLSQYGRGVAVGPSGAVALAGRHTGADFGGGLIVANGWEDVFVAGFTPSGAHAWSHGFGVIGANRADSVALDPDGCPVSVGEFRDTIDFGDGALTTFGGDQHGTFVVRTAR